MRRYSPTRSEVYTMAEIENELELRDSPNLNFVVENTAEQVLQTSHIPCGMILTVPGFADTKWRYAYETSEWIPIFYYAEENERPITDFIDFELSIDPYSDKKSFFCTPKGFPRKQYYALNEQNEIVVRSTGRPYNDFLF